jgi:hypothetical protein
MAKDMKTSRFSEEQHVEILKQAQAGTGIVPGKDRLKLA